MIAETHHQQEKIFDVIADERHGRGPNNVSAARAADIIPVDDERLQHDGERQRRDGKKGAAQAQRQITHPESDDAGDRAADDDENREG